MSQTERRNVTQRERLRQILDELLSEGRAGRNSRGEARRMELWKELDQELQRLAIDIRRGAATFARNDAADVVQTVLAKLQSPSTQRLVRAAGSPEGYVIVMLRNAARDVDRHNLRRAAIAQKIEDLTSSTAAAHNPTTALDSKIAIRQALSSLHEVDRLLLLMRLDGMSITDAARRVGLSYSAAAVRIFRAIRNLKGK